MNEFIRVAIALAVVSAVCLFCVLLESGSSPDRRALWSSARLNLGYYLAIALFVTPILLFTGPAIVAVVNRTGGGLIALPRSGWGFAIAVLAVLLFTDLLEYSYHRAEHRIPFLWRLHALHHSEEAFNATTSLRQIWFDQLVRAFLLFPLVGILFQVEPAVVLTARLLTMVTNAQAHMGWRVSWGPFWWLMNSPQYHRCHHSFQAEHVDRNLAPMFPIWDILFRTCYRPAPGEFPPTGISPSVQPSLTGALLWPLPLLRQAR